MLDTLKQTLDGVVVIPATDRVETLRQGYYVLESRYSIDRARIETQVLKETEGEPMITRRAKVFSRILREMPIEIHENELIVGGNNGKHPGMNISPANAGYLAGKPSEFDGNIMGKRPITTPLSDEDMAELQEMIPYWVENGRMGAGYHYGHNIHGFEKVLKKGFLGIKKDAEDRIAGLDMDDPEDAAKVPFLEGVVMAMDAAAEHGARYAARARELAESETDSARKEELLEIAAVCDRVPANPAETFHEAIQAFLLTWLLLYYEYPHDLGFSQGRMDQYLYPYYRADLDAGRTTRERAQELIDCSILKVNYEGKVGSIGVGGLNAKGRDASNDLTYMFIEAMMHTRLINPYFAVHIHSKTPDDLLIKAAKLTSLGTGHPQYINADVMIDQALARGSIGGNPMTLEDARASANVGCLELVIPGKDSGYLYTSGSNLALAMDLAMTNGKSRRDGKLIGPQTGDPRAFQSFDEVKDAFHKQLTFMRDNSEKASNAGERNIIDNFPTVYESALIDDCIETGICREEGGAHYNFNTGTTTSGSSDAGDSLAVIKKLVFEEGKITMDELCDALDKNFEGYEDLHKMCLEAPKFGNDIDYVDDETAWVVHQWASEYTKMKNLRGGQCCPGGSPMFNFVPDGHRVGALPCGRLAFTPLADASSPSPGKDVSGPTAVFKSLGKLDHSETLGGLVTNMRIDPVVFEGDGLGRIVDLLRSFVDQKIVHTQINVVKSETLLDAQKHPENYGDLVVKVAGYNAFFARLTKPLQDSIISRTEHGV